MLTKKDLIAINQQFSNGIIINDSSLDFILAQTYRSKHWYKTMCLLTRTILIDHIFEDGNKRTAALIIMNYLEMNNRTYNPDKIATTIIKITKENITDIRKIGRLINHVTQ